MERIIVGVSGATGMPLARALLKQLKQLSNIEIHLVYTKGAKITYEQEMDGKICELEELADVVHDNDNIGASIATYGFAAIAENHGWNATILTWIIISAAGLAVCFAAAPLWKKFRKEYADK